MGMMLGSQLRALLATAAVMAAAVGIAWLLHHWPVIVGGIIALVVVIIIMVGAFRFLVLLAVRSKWRTSRTNNEAATDTAVPFANVLDTHFRQQTLATSPFLLFEAPVLAPPPPNMIVLATDDLPPAILPPTTSTAMATTTTRARARTSMVMDQPKPNDYVPAVYTKTFS
jgi:hypothetical protein